MKKFKFLGKKYVLDLGQFRTFCVTTLAYAVFAAVCLSIGVCIAKSLFIL